jgi:hypothetical protein
MSDQHNPENAATLYWKLVEAVQSEHWLDHHEALSFITESCKAGGLPGKDESELVEQRREVALSR